MKVRGKLEVKGSAAFFPTGNWFLLQAMSLSCVLLAKCLDVEGILSNFKSCPCHLIVTLLKVQINLLVSQFPYLLNMSNNNTYLL
jgi:hypothetical protein